MRKPTRGIACNLPRGNSMFKQTKQLYFRFTIDTKTPFCQQYKPNFTECVKNIFFPENDRYRVNQVPFRHAVTSMCVLFIAIKTWTHLERIKQSGPSCIDHTEQIPSYVFTMQKRDSSAAV